MKTKPEYFAHETAVLDAGCSIGSGTKIWHFSHIMRDAVLGENCNLGQNVVVSPGVVLGTNVKVQNNVSIYTGVICEDDVFLGPSMVFTNIINPRSAIVRRNQFLETRDKFSERPQIFNKNINQNSNDINNNFISSENNINSNIYLAPSAPLAPISNLNEEITKNNSIYPSI